MNHRAIFDIVNPNSGFDVDFHTIAPAMHKAYEQTQSRSPNTIYKAGMTTEFLLNERHAFVVVENGRLVKRFMTGLRMSGPSGLYAYDSEISLHCDYAPCERDMEAKWAAFIICSIGVRHPAPRLNNRTTRVYVQNGGAKHLGFTET